MLGFKVSAAAVAVTAIACSVAAQPEVPGFAFDLVESDIFVPTGASNNDPPNSNWATSMPGWVGTAPGAFDDAQVVVANVGKNWANNGKGLLKIKAADNNFFPAGVDDECDCGYTGIATGMVMSTKTYGYGFYEFADVRLSKSGLLSSIWLQGASGEINVIDSSVAADGTHSMKSTYHCFDQADAGGANTVSGAAYDHIAAHPKFDVTKPHTYAVDWSADGVDIYVDDEKVHSYSADCLNADSTDGMNIILSMEATENPVSWKNNKQNSMTIERFNQFEKRATTTAAPTTVAPTTVPSFLCDKLGWQVDSQYADSSGEGDVCASVAVGTNGRCIKKTKLATAQQTCQALGAELCTEQQIIDKVGRQSSKDGGCQLHKKWVWTQDSCTRRNGKKGQKIRKGNGGGATKCVGKGGQRAVMCCAANTPQTGQMAGARQRSASIDSEDDETAAGGSVAAAATAGVVGSIIIVVAILGVVVARRRRAAAADDGETYTRRASVSSITDEVSVGSPAFVEEPALGRYNSSSSMNMTDLDTDNGFVLDEAGNVRVASVRRGNPMFRGSVYAADDAIGPAGLSETSAM